MSFLASGCSGGILDNKLWRLFFTDTSDTELSEELEAAVVLGFEAKPCRCCLSLIDFVHKQDRSDREIDMPPETLSCQTGKYKWPFLYVEQ